MTGMIMFGAIMKVFNDADESGKDAEQMVDSFEFWSVVGPQIFGVVALAFLVSTVLEVVRSGFKAVFVCFVQVRDRPGTAVCVCVFSLPLLCLSSAPLAPILHYDWVDDLAGVTWEGGGLDPLLRRVSYVLCVLCVLCVDAFLSVCRMFACFCVRRY